MLSVTAGRYRASGCSTAKALGCLGTDADDGDRAARIIMAALGIETDAVANYCLPQYWPTARDSVPASLATGFKRRPQFLA